MLSLKAQINRINIAFYGKFMKYVVGIFALIMWSCSHSPEKKQVNHIENATFKDSLSIDLLSLRNKKSLGISEIITVKHDPVYHKLKRYNAIFLNDILLKYSGLKSLKVEDYNMIFECEDGYKPEMPLKKLIDAKAFLAISDVDAPKGSEWEKIIKDGHEMKAAPFYIVYQDVSDKDGSYKWPYNVVKLHFEPVTENLAFILPNDKSAKKGYELFQKHCQTCHAINGVGGEMGPELNFPKNITEYWKTEDLHAFIKNPSAYRHSVKMPKLTLTDADISEIIKYLKAMKNQKKGI
ncbi:MAG: cytochrome c [Bacteroidota bacterium]